MELKKMLNQAKQKLYEKIDKGNTELKKYSFGVRMTIYSRPILGGFITKQVFLEDNELLVESTDFKDDIKVHTIFRLEDDEEIYVVDKIEEEIEEKTISKDGKTFTYSCHKVIYESLNDKFTDDTFGYAYYEMDPQKQQVLNIIQAQLEKKSFAVKEKKEACLKLWQYFCECVSYRLSDHYVMHTFVKIADDYVEDFSSLLLKLFA